MASLPSSDHHSASIHGPAVSFPPRSQLPPGITVETIPWIGTTWYERGFAYWMRRLALVLFIAVLVALVTGVLILFLRAVYESSGRHAWFYGLLGFEVAFTLITGPWTLIRMIKKPARFPPSPADERRWARLRPRVGKVLIFGMLLGDLFLVLTAALTYGWCLAFLVRSLAPVTPPERQARQRLAMRLSEHTGRTGD